MSKLTLDIVVPTIRLNIDKLRAIAQLNVPDQMLVHCFFVVDNPNGTDTGFDPQLNKEITIIRNATNLGGHVSRNIGINAGTGEYILFLDDDIDVPRNLLELYFEAIQNYPEAPGFIGSSEFPSCINSFTRAAVASDILTFWDIAKWQKYLAWGITANLLVKRKAVGEIRFSDRFPRNGGGEDVDFCLKIVERSRNWFVSIPDAKILHPWWGGGSHQYKRFARWAYGDSTLPKLHPAYKFRNAPNLIETALITSFVAILAFIFLGIPLTWILGWFVAAVSLECIMDGVRMKLKGKNVSLPISIQATSIRLSNDLGRIAGHLKNFHPSGITERLDYFMTGKHIGYERKVAVLKFIGFAVTALLLFFVLR